MTVSFRETGENGIGGGDGGGGSAATAIDDDDGQARAIKIRCEGTGRRVRWRGDGVRITSAAVRVLGRRRAVLDTAVLPAR